jgi:serine/threonine-protein kinase HipA
MPDSIAHVALGESLTPVGQLRFTQAGPRQFSTFSYDPAWIENPRAFAVQPTLPLEGGPFHTSGQPGNMRDALAGVFADAAPDSWGRRLLERAYGNGLSEFEYLTLSDDACRQGALRFLDDAGKVIQGGAADAVPRLIDLQAITAIARAYEQGKEISPEEMQALAGAGGSGGARPKANVRDDNTLWLAKFTSVHDQQPIERVEVATHTRSQVGVDRHAVSGGADPAVRPAWNRAYSLHLGSHRPRQDRNRTRFLYGDRRFHAGGGR